MNSPKVIEYIYCEDPIFVHDMRMTDIETSEVNSSQDFKSPRAGPLLPHLAPPHHRPRVLCGRHTHRRPQERRAPTLHPGHGPRRLLQPRCPGPRPQDGH